MKEETRLQFHRRYLEICREKGWITEDDRINWPESAEERASAAREMFGLAMISSTDGTFQSAREQIGAESISATPLLEEAIGTLNELTDEQKSAVLTLVDDVLDSSVYDFTIQLDRFDHGFLSLRFQAMDEEAEPIPESEVEINPFGYFEMFQDALRWKDEYGMADQIGRPLDPHGIHKPKE